MVWKFSLFGKMTLTAPSGQSVTLESRKCEELLAYLALRRSTHLDRGTVAEALWPEVDTIASRNRLKQLLSRLRKEIPGLPILASGKHEIGLCETQVETDLEIIERRLKWLRALTMRDRQNAARQILDATRKNFLQGLSAPWIEAERTRLRIITAELGRELGQSAEQRTAQFRIGDKLGVLRVPIVGRATELKQIRSWLADSEPRVLYLVGSPGVGKTRILDETLESCHDVCDAVVSLTTVQAWEAPWQEGLGQAAGISDRQKLTTGLMQLLNDFAQPLIAIDDADQADAAMTEWIAQIMVAVPRLRMIATVRKRPFDPLAKVLEIRPLPTQAREESIAANLLMQFAANVGVSEAAIEKSRAVLGELAEYLEGLPLALEVAAGWLPLLTPEALLKKMSSGSPLVVRRAAKGRMSLLSCMETTCRELTTSERIALLCLSLCKGGCGEALAEEMIGAEWPWLIQSLTDRSLVLQSPGNAGTRFIVLQALRESVRTLSTREEMETSLNFHSEACFRLGLLATWEINEGDRRKWLQWLRDEGDNVLLACERSIEDARDVGKGIHMLSCLGAAFWVIGRPQDHQRVSDRALEECDAFFEVIDSATPWMIVQHRVLRMVEASHLVEGLDLIREFCRLCEEAGDFTTAAACLDLEGGIAAETGELNGALHCFERASELFIRDGRRRQALWAQSKIAKIEMKQGFAAESMDRKRRSFMEACLLGDLNSEGMYAKEFARLAMAENQWEEACTLAKRSVHAFRSAGETITQFDALLVQCAALLGVGDSSSAASVLQEAENAVPLGDEKRLGHLASIRFAENQDLTHQKLLDFVDISAFH